MPFWSSPRRFVPNFTSVAAPLSKLTSKGKPELIQWTPAMEKAFNQFKTVLTSSAVLWYSDFQWLFMVQTDTSENGLSAVLSKLWDREEHQVVSISCNLMPTDQHYATIKREAIVVKWAVENMPIWLASSSS